MSQHPSRRLCYSSCMTLHNRDHNCANIVVEYGNTSQVKHATRYTCRAGQLHSRTRDRTWPSTLVRRPPHGRRRVVVAVVCPGAPYGPPFTEIARDDVIRLFPTESSFDIGPFSPAAIVPRSRSSRTELRAKRKTQEIPSQLGFSYRVSSVGCRLCVTRLAYP